MNAERLLQHFDRISEAPDAIPRLRRFILDLAVRGKLVEQDPNDEPVEELLKRIQAEKARLLREGKVRQQAPLPKIAPDQEPFQLPKSWAWSRLGEVIVLLSGQHLQPNEYSDNKQSGPPYVTGPADFSANGLIISRYALVRKAVATEGQLLLTVKGAGVGKTTTCDIPEVAISRQLMALTAINWNQHFLSLTTHLLAETLKESARSLIPGISRDDVELFVFGLPPLAEQHRIVAKVDELMALCDQLEAAKTQREQSRDRLVAASLHRLNQPADVEEADTPNTFRDHARFTFNHLQRLTTRPAHIKQLRQTILNLAVRGKLVPQDPNDEPAAQLLRRIKEEKARLLKEGRIKEKTPAPGVQESEQPYQVPSSWAWIRFAELIHHSDAGLSPKTEGFPRSGNHWGVLKVSAVSWENFKPEENKQLLPGPTPPESVHVRAGDFLISRANTSELVAKCVIVESQPNRLILSDKIVRLHITEHCDRRFLSFVNNHAGYARSYYVSEASGTSQSMKNVSRPVIYGLPIPLPPLAEQHRIVAKVDELMALCDQLEAQLTTTEADTRRLLEAVLHEALAPALEETA